jgi:glucokinase
VPEAPAVWAGVDLGGTKMEVALVDPDGRVLARERRTTAAQRGADAVLDELAATVCALAERSAQSPAGVGLGVAGQVDLRTGIVHRAPNLAWTEVAVRDLLAARLRMPVTVLNDVQAATYGEWRYGAGLGADDLVALFVGTGVGGGIVSHGRLVRGHGGSAGELGHMTVELGGRLCRCGNRGCLEALIGGWAIVEQAAEAARSAGGSMLHGEVTAGQLARAARAGDATARSLLDRLRDALAAGAAAIVNAFNPSVLVLGGGVLDRLPELVDELPAALQGRALAAALEGLRVVRPALGGQAGAVGAAAWGRACARPA